MSKSEVAIVIPCFNEVNTIISVYKKNSLYGNVLIVDDCSKDGTRKKLAQNKIKFIKNTKNIGYEASIIKGMKYILKYKKKLSILLLWMLMVNYYLNGYLYF